LPGTVEDCYAQILDRRPVESVNAEPEGLAVRKASRKAAGVGPLLPSAERFGKARIQRRKAEAAPLK
jgi:hypothetical protein